MFPRIGAIYIGGKKYYGSSDDAVEPPVIELVSIAVSPASVSIVEGFTHQFTAIGTYDDESTSDLTSSVTWSSNNANTTITSEGLASGITNGSSIITATLGDIFGTASITIEEAIPAPTTNLIADHNAVAAFDGIPQRWIDEVKKMQIAYVGESHAVSIGIGMQSIENTDAKYAVNVNTSPLAYTDQHLRVANLFWGDLSNETGWRNIGEEDWYKNALGISRIKAGLTYVNDTANLPVSAIGFGWCWDPNERAAQMPDYINATQEYIDYCISNSFDTKVLFTTGPVDGSNASGEIGWNKYLAYEAIRNAVNSSESRILFDFADILCYDDGSEIPHTVVWDGNTYPVITPANYGTGSQAHMSETGCIRLAKAMWWMMARVAGWNGVPDDEPFVADYHVTVDGSDLMTSQGTEQDPWSLWRATYEIQTQYNQPQAGQTVVLHAGNYMINQTAVWSNATPGNHVTYRAAGDGLVTLTGLGAGLVIHTMGGYIIFRDMIITCSLRNRVGLESEGDPYDRNNIDGQIGLGTSFPGAKAINCIIHDTAGVGIQASGDGTDTEYYGNIIFNNGFYISNSATPGKAHCMYMSNNAGKRIVDTNIMFNAYGHGYQFYTESVQQLAGLDIFKNTVFNSGANAKANGIGDMRNFMIGGNAPLKDIALEDNNSYLFSGSVGTQIQVGYNNDGDNANVSNNYVAGGGVLISPMRMKNVTIKSNTVVHSTGSSYPLMQIIYPENEPVEVYDIDENTYFSDRTGDVFKTGYVTDYTLTEWQALGYEINSQILPRSSLVNVVKLAPNKYESGRAHVTIFNHLELTNVMVDLSSVYSIGDTYYMYDVQDMDSVMGPFTYDGELVSFPMNLTSVKQSQGDPGPGFVVPHTPIEFGCFVVVKRIIF